MVDKALYVGTSGAKNSMHELSLIANNLANANTSGFRADFEIAKQKQVGNKDATRVYSVSEASYSDFKEGPIINTGRELDVAISGNGFMAVQSKSGKEGYTRAGDLQIKDGVLMTASGDPLLSTSGIAKLPSENIEKLNIGVDGTLSAKMKGQPDIILLGQIKLVNPPISQLQKGKDGLFYLINNGTAKQDDSVRLSPGSLEGSNVNVVDMMTHLIDLSRHFDMHTTLMKNVQDLASKANELLALPK